MKDFFKSRKFKILLLSLGLMVGLIIGAGRTGLLGKATNQIVNIILYPFESATSFVTDKVTGFLERLVESGVYYEENIALKTEIQELKNQMIEYEKYKKENEQLRELVGLKTRFVDQVYEPAMVVERDPLDVFYSFTINKGSVDGVKEGDPVITKDGLIGRVSSVTSLEARVITIFNPALEVSAYSMKSLDSGVITGAGNATLSENGQTYLLSISNESQMEPGDMIITKGSGVFPAEIYIGQVISIEKAEHGLSKIAVIEVSVDIKNIKEVLVITEFKGQITESPLGNLEQYPETSEESSIEESSAEESSAQESSKAPVTPVKPPVQDPQEESSEEPKNPWDILYGKDEDDDD